MRVEWDSHASSERKEVATYIRKKFGIRRARMFKEEVDQTVEMLRRSPGIGQIDPLFEGRAETYRSVIINGLNKMVYYVKGDTLRITSFWDTRREPKNQASQTE